MNRYDQPSNSCFDLNQFLTFFPFFATVVRFRVRSDELKSNYWTDEAFMHENLKTKSYKPTTKSRRQLILNVIFTAVRYFD